MAQVKWNKKAEKIFLERVLYSYHEFGTTTAQKWHTERKRIEHQLEGFPESYPPEFLTRNRKLLYRSCHIMTRFKIVYHYSKTSDIVRIVDIWDTIQHPENLKKRIK
ncbi:MAG: type II toxin-antitoxin system RelE/ParE family toxin [Prevotella sp.]|nr:type II toxin-antitoxin system RelE/ParE family toxin [Prevotella sp.]